MPTQRHNFQRLNHAKYTLLPTLLLFSSSILFAQFRDIYFHKLGSADGLSNNAVTSITQDGTGYIWIATLAGLNRYDGNHFVAYRHSFYDSASISSDAIYKIVSDKENKIWAATSNSLSCLLPDGRFSNYYLRDNSGKIVYKTGLFRQIGILPDGRVLTNSYKPGLLQVDEKHNCLIPFVPTATTPDGASFTLTDNGWIGYRTENDYLISHDGGKNFFSILNKKNVPPAVPFKSITIANIDNGYCYLYTALDQDTAQLALIKIDLDTKNVSFIPILINLTGMAIYPDHRFWFGYWTGGLVAYDETTEKQIKQFLPSADRKNTIPSNAIQCMFKDRDNNLWIGTDNGIAYFNPGTGNIHVVNSNIEGFEKINLSSITDLLPDDKGNIIMSMFEYGDSSNHGIAGFNTANNTCKKIITAKANDLSGLIWSMLKDKDGNLILNTQIGLFHYDFKSHSFTRSFPYHISSMASQTLKGLSAFYKDNEGNFWYGLWRKGLVKYDPVTEKEDYFSANNSDSSRRLNGNLIESVAEDGKKQIWISTNESSILNCIKPNGSLSHIPLMINGQALTTILKKIVPDSTGELWIGTSNLGLIRYNPTTNQTRLYGTRDGLPNTTIDNLCFDRKDRLWIYTATGLAWMDPRRENINWLHNELPGFRDNFDPQPMIIGNDGKIYLGNSATLYYFDPDEILSDLKLNAPVLLSITASDKATQLPPETKEIIIQPEEENIRIAFTSINILHSRQINYAFQLKDYDKSWTATHDGEAVYNKLPPGTYQFVMAAGIEGAKESRKTTVVTIKALAAYYQTWWFKLIIGAILALLLATAIYYSSTRYLRKKLSTLEKQKEINAVRNRIAQDIHDDIGSGLTKISIQSELAKQHKSLTGDDYEDILSKIHKQSSDLVTNLGEIVWTINPEYDKAESLEAYFRYYIHQYMDGTPVRSQFNFSGPSHDIVVNPDIKRNLFLMLKESLNNIVKHANATEAAIDFTVKNNHYQMMIKDNGVGMDLSKNKPFGNGIANLEKRAGQIQAHIQINSKKGQGAEILVKGRFY